MGRRRQRGMRQHAAVGTRLRAYYFQIGEDTEGNPQLLKFETDGRTVYRVNGRTLVREREGSGYHGLVMSARAYEAMERAVEAGTWDPKQPRPVAPPFWHRPEIKVPPKKG